MTRAVLVVLVSVTSACELFISVPNGKLADATDGGGGDDGSADGSAVVHECDVTAECTAPLVCVDHACRPCDDDAHCGAPDQAVCLPDGTCADVQRIAYASPAGGGTACTAAAPCTFDQAFANAKASATIDIVKLQPGTYPRGTMLTLDDTVIVAAQGATVTSTATIEIFREQSGDLTVVGGTFVGNQQFNILCITSTTAALHIHRVVSKDGAYGIGEFSCATTITRSTITNNGSIGIYAQGGSLHLSNSFLTGNGLGAGGAGGLQILNVPDARVELTTIAGNASAGMDPGGIQCTSSTVAVTSSIVYANAGTTAIAASCPITYSVVDPSYTSGSNNTTSDPMFLGNGDYHLATGSPARGGADPALTTPAVDRDGEPRPQTGTRFDCGADEIP